MCVFGHGIDDKGVNVTNTVRNDRSHYIKALGNVKLMHDGACDIFQSPNGAVYKMVSAQRVEDRLDTERSPFILEETSFER